MNGKENFANIYKIKEMAESTATLVMYAGVTIFFTFDRKFFIFSILLNKKVPNTHFRDLIGIEKKLSHSASSGL